jgi:hypothetical protein
MSTERRPEALTTRDCAEWMGYTTQFIRNAITRGVTAADGTTVKLEAETTARTARRKSYRVYRDNFTGFLIAIGWSHIPGQHAPVHPWPSSAAGPR